MQITKHNSFVRTNVFDSDQIQKVFMSDKVHRQIRYLCSKISNVEWSGILVYNFKDGENISDENTAIQLLNVIPMQKGDATYTEYNFNEKKRDTDGYDDAMIDYFINHPESMDENNPYRIGMIHSHQSFGTFFSGTDTSELIDNGQLHDFYLSLITNNADENIAKIAFPSTTITKSNTTYTLKDNQKGTFNFNVDNEDITGNETVVRDCEIIYDDVDSGYVVEDDEFFINQLEEIIQKAELPTPVRSYNDWKTSYSKNWTSNKKVTPPTINNNHKVKINYSNDYLKQLIRAVKSPHGLRYNEIESIVDIIEDLIEENDMKLSVQARVTAPNNYWDPDDIIDYDDTMYQGLFATEDEADYIDAESLALEALLDYFYACTGVDYQELDNYVEYIELHHVDLIKDIDIFDDFCEYNSNIYNAVLTILLDYQAFTEINKFISELLSPDTDDERNK